MNFRKVFTITVAGAVALHLSYAVAHYVVNNSAFEAAYVEDFKGSEFWENDLSLIHI